MKEIFTNIYKNKEWLTAFGTYSGPGSSIQCSKPFLDFLQDFLIKNKINSILDVGCGDFNLLKHLNLENVNYKGIDVVDFVIEETINKHQCSNIVFECKDLTKEKEDQNYDLIIIKDVLQHLSYKNIFALLKNMNGKNLFLINDFFEDYNVDVKDGGWRYMNMAIEPFNLKGKYIFEWPVFSVTKKVYHVINE